MDLLEIGINRVQKKIREMENLSANTQDRKNILNEI